MEKHNRLHTLEHRPATGGNLLLLGLWMRSAFVGAAIAAAGFASLIDPPQGVPILTALTWIVAGGTFAWLAWQRTATLLDRIDAEEPTRSDRGDASPIRPAARAPDSPLRTPTQDCLTSSTAR